LTSFEAGAATILPEDYLADTILPADCFEVRVFYGD